MKNCVQPNGSPLTLTAPRALASGDGFLVGAIFAVAASAAANGTPVEGEVHGVFTLPKATGAITAGARVFWDNTNFVVTTTATSNFHIGCATAAAASGDATVNVNLDLRVPASGA